MKYLKITGKVVLLTLCMVFFSLAFISAIEPDYTFKQYEVIDLKVPCVTNVGKMCDATVGCNMTIFFPDNTVALDGVAMTYNRNYYNYLLNNGETDVLGYYPVTVNCVGDSSGFLTFYYEVTTTGKGPQVKLPLFLILCSLGLFVVGLFTRSNELGFLSGIFFAITGAYFMIYGLGDMADLYTRTIAGILIGFGLIVVVLSGWEWITHED